MLARAPKALLLVLLLTSMVQPAAHGNGVLRRPDEMRPPSVGSGEQPVTITFSYGFADRRESDVNCLLRLRRDSDGVGVLRAALAQDCIQSFRTVRDGRRLMLDCINDICAYLTKSPGIVPDTRWAADWTGEQGSDPQSDYGRFGLRGFSASDGDFFSARLYAVN